MKKVLLVAFLLIGFLPAVSFAYTVSLHDFTGSDAEVLIDITGDGTQEITFDIQVVNPAFADIQGVWFNLDTVPGDITVSGANVTTYLFLDNAVANLGGGVTITPALPFDGGIVIGTPGIGSDDIYSTIFTIKSASSLVLGDLFAARLTSVGDTENNREGSSKLLGTKTPSPVPEPATMLLFGTGLVGLAGIGRKKFF